MLENVHNNDTVTERSDNGIFTDYAQLKRVEKHINEYSWTESNENVVKEWGEKAFGYKTLHMHEANKWKSFSNRMHMLIIFLSCLTGVTNLSTYAQIQWLTIMMGILNVCTGLMVSVVKYYKPDELFQLHLISAKKYGKLYRTISLELGMERKNRGHAEDISKQARLTYDTIVEESPFVNDKTIEWFRMKIENNKNNAHVPDVVSFTKVIDVYENPNVKIKE